MLANGSYAVILLATTDLDVAFARLHAEVARSRSSSPTAFATAPSAIPRQPDPHPGAALSVRRPYPALTVPVTPLTRLADAWSCPVVALPTTCQGTLPRRCGSLDGVSACVHHLAL
jgi:hypothetical protein